MALPWLFFAGCAAYLWYLLLNALPGRKRVVILPRPDAAALPATPSESRKKSVDESENAASGSLPRFVVLIPAHNEELLLGAALQGLRGLDYPLDALAVVVIADNCDDQTATIARQCGALALERFDTQRIGKGFALEDTLNWLMQPAVSADTVSGTASNAALAERGSNGVLAEQNTGGATVGGDSTRLLSGSADDAANEAWERARRFDAVVVLDADTFVSPNLLRVFAAQLQAGNKAIQARYDVLNTDESWRTRLMSCALALAHVVKPLGRERLGLSDGLKGNGMCFARSVVEAVPWSGDSITEDIEYALRLCRAGYRIAFTPEACVWAQMPTTGAQAKTQRERWEGGRYRLLFTVAPNLLRESLRTRNRLLWDRAIELIVPPFAEMFALPALLGVLCALLGWGLHWRAVQAFAGLWALILLLQAGYLFTGMWVARMPARIAFSLLRAPFYIMWKLGVYAVMAAGRSAGGWKRTERHELGR